MELIRAARTMQTYADARRQEGRRLVLVPTMGALHEGHRALVHAAKQHGDHITVSIFVNPTQFGPGEDFEQYPRQLDRDRKALAEVGGVDTLFVPSVEEMYPGGAAHAYTRVTVGKLDEHLCGRFRPGHFEGVTTVVAKLFHLCKPHAAVFGLKDAQQFIILRRMVRELFFDVEMVGVPTVREENGLARSSRNAYLSAEERAQAAVLSQALTAAQQQIEEGEQQVGAIVETMHQKLAQAPAADVQYAEVVDAETVQPLQTIAPGQQVLAALAVYFGNTRLIDNAFVRAPGLA